MHVSAGAAGAGPVHAADDEIAARADQLQPAGAARPERVGRFGRSQGGLLLAAHDQQRALRQEELSLSFRIRRLKRRRLELHALRNCGDQSRSECREIPLREAKREFVGLTARQRSQ